MALESTVGFFLLRLGIFPTICVQITYKKWYRKLIVFRVAVAKHRLCDFDSSVAIRILKINTEKVKMKLKALILLCPSFLVASVVSATETSIVTSEVIESSVQVHGDRISYFTESSIGGLDYFEFDMASEQWFGFTAEGDLVGGRISGAASEEYSLHGLQIPCFTSPWVFGGCVVLAAIGQQICDSRQRTAIQRIQAQCGPGELAEIGGATGCGNVENLGCRRVNLEHDQRDDGVDG